MSRVPDVLIVGGGVIGLTTAYYLAKQKVRVQVIDRGPLGKEASWAGAGIVPPMATGELTCPLERLRKRSISRLPILSQELLDRTGIDNEFHTCGGVEHNIFAAQLARWQRAGVTFKLDNRTAQLAYSQLRNPRHLAALIEACRQLEVELSPETPIDPEKLPPAGQYLIAAGAWSNSFLPPDCQMRIHPVRGQIVLFKPAKPVLHHIIIDGHRYLVPRKDGRVVAGSTEEPEAGFVKETTSDGVQTLIRFAISHVPALADAVIERSWAGLRPGSTDGWPVIGRFSPGLISKASPEPAMASRFFISAGHFRAGLQLSAASGEEMAAMMLGKPTELDAFRPDRPAIRLPEPLFRS